MKCYWCKKKIKEGEKHTTVTSRIGDWVSEPHPVCLKCAKPAPQQGSETR